MRRTAMARTSPLKAAGLDLLDRVYRNQLVVDLQFSQNELLALQDLTTQSRTLLAESGLDGLQLERAIHFTLAVLEFRLADTPEEMARRSGVAYSLPDMDDATFRSAKKFVEDARQGMLLGLAGSVLEDPQIVFQVAAHLERVWPHRQPTLRHRLTERVFAFDFQDAPLQVLSWLARAGIVRSAKYDEALITTEISDQVVVRAVSLWELDNIRRFILSTASGGKTSTFIRTMTMIKGVSDRGFAELADAMKRYANPAGDGKVVVISDAGWEQDLGSTLVSLSTLAPWTRMELRAQSTAVSAVGAYLMATAERFGKENRARFAEVSSRPSLAHEASDALAAHGFAIDPKTLYRAFKDDLMGHLARIRGYYQVLADTGWVPPAEYPDYYQLLQAAADPPTSA